MKEYLILALKGIGMGAANVIPGVSGGTIAFITGIFERLIRAIRSFDLNALKLLLRGKLVEFSRYVDLQFLVAVLTGILIAILSLARLLDFLFHHYPVYVWSYFFGLIVASVVSVGRTVKKWKASVVLMFLVGAIFAVLLTLLRPANENSNMFYLFICGIVAACSMILPGLSGSFVLVLMGNYQLVMIHAVNTLNLKILFPVLIGAAVGLIAFSHFLSWILRKFRDQTVAVLTGFIFGSLGIIWPWKEKIYLTDIHGEWILNRKGEKIISGYHWFIPDSFSTEVIVALGIMLAGVLTIVITEYLAARKTSS